MEKKEIRDMVLAILGILLFLGIALFWFLYLGINPLDNLR